MAASPSTIALSVPYPPSTAKLTVYFVGGTLLSLNFTITVTGCTTFTFAIMLPLVPVPVSKVPMSTVQ